MREKFPKKYLLIGVTLFLLLSLPPLLIEGIRSKTASLFSPLWRGVRPLFSKANSSADIIKKLEGENYLLYLELSKLRSYLEQTHYAPEILATSSTKKAILPAQVIYRDPSSWGSFIWVNVGKEVNENLPSPVIEKNSPVLLGNALIGVVDWVGKKESRIRLITDVGLKPSVRVFRKGEYLAKGIVQGAGKGPLLKGAGFNYDFSDKEGGARELNASLLLEGDLLVTTGMDGVFPQGLKVASVSKVYPLHEGAYTYEIEALPIAGNLERVQTVFIIPALVPDHEKEES